MAAAMACNFLVDDNLNSDNASEYSETGATGWDPCWDSKEELIELMAKLGIQDVADLHRERFPIDRKKLEQMLAGGDEMVIPADVFFSKMMEDTNTYIFWPNRLKLGAKSKKDPFIRVFGRDDDVQMAKTRITNLLGPKSSRITMKMDVSYTDHSHIIGRGGLCIKRVMEESQCHVHFPDSNRVNLNEKSNQVSISGNVEKVEKARSRVRDLIPLIFCFELPITTKNVDITSSYVSKIQDQYKVQVMFKYRHAKLHATLVMVKGVEWEADQVKKATLLLIEYMCENLANQTLVQMSMEISPQHHPTVLGKDHSNLKAITKLTSCKIMFPDAQDPNIATLKKSNVTITGNINDVYRARQLLMGSLPLIIMFDLPEDRTNQANEIQTACDVTISIKRKSKQNTLVCFIKGIEKHANNIYKARNLMLGIDDPPLVADIPSSYHFPTQSTDFIPTLPNLNLNPSPFSHPISPGLSAMLSPLWHYPSVPSPNPIPHPQPFGAMQQPHFAYNVTQQSLGSSGYHSSVNQSQYVSNSVTAFEQNNNSSLSTISSNSSLLCPSYNLFDNSSLDKREVSPTSPSDFQTTYRSSFSEPKKELRRNGYDAAADESKRLAGLRAMHNRPNVNSYRVPTDFWCGYGISLSPPNNFGKSTSSTTEAKMDDDVWRMPTSLIHDETLANVSNLLEHVPSHILNRIVNSEWYDIADLLTSLDLEKYISLFTRNQIDLTRFATMNEGNLIWIGIYSSEARKRMLLAICELKKRSRPFMLAPGSERGPKTNYTNRW